MASATPAGSASAVVSTAPQQQQSQNTRSNRFHGRRKTRPQHHEPNAAPDSTTSYPQQPHRLSMNSQSAGGHAPANTTQQQPPRRPPKPRQPVPDGQIPTQGEALIDSSTPGPSSSSGPNRDRRRPQRPRHVPQTGAEDQAGSDSAPTQPGRPTGGNRRKRFRGKLTENEGSSGTPSTSHPSEKYHTKTETSAADDLTSRLIRELSFPPYPDCPICFSSIHREQPIWSCSPSITTILPHDAEGPPQYCWTTFHLKCIRSWASKSVKDVEDAWRARGEEGRTGDWRCPGCQAKREVIPKVYWYVSLCSAGLELVLIGYSGVSAALPQIPNHHDYLHPTHVEVLVLVLGRVDAVIHVPFRVIPDLVLHVKLQPV